MSETALAEKVAGIREQRAKSKLAAFGCPIVWPENSIDTLLDALDTKSAENERLRDLVRYERHALHEEGLITDEEFAELLQTEGAVERLASYDTLRKQLEAKSAVIEGMRKAIEFALTTPGMIRGRDDLRAALVLANGLVGEGGEGE